MKLTQSVFSAYYSAKNSVQNFLKREDGVTAIEYAIVAAGVAAVVVVLFQNGGTFQRAMEGIFDRLSRQLNTLLPSGGTGGAGAGAGAAAGGAAGGAAAS
ncbi:Flp family type IVb pilin [Frischella perrara]|uniref:Flp family type IVb pilin n=1 Tax=Frischella perrara TaxID=1267021 RepID=UPI0023F51823|nr:Flp family type IVb pilin [Frischella perrara]